MWNWDHALFSGIAENFCSLHRLVDIQAHQTWGPQEVQILCVQLQLPCKEWQTKKHTYLHLLHTATAGICISYLRYCLGLLNIALMRMVPRAEELRT